MARYIDAERIQYYRHDKIGLGVDYSINEKEQDDIAYKEQIDLIPIADVAEVVRCKECRFKHTKTCFAKHETADNDFCSNGRKRGQHGKWIYSNHACGYYMSGIMCSECGYGTMGESLPECPNCGAKMDGGKDKADV